jgi:hypothetical protein
MFCVATAVDNIDKDVDEARGAGGSLAVVIFPPAIVKMMYPRLSN